MNRHFQLPGQLRTSLIAGLIAGALFTAPLWPLTAAGEGGGKVAGARQSGEAAGASYSASYSTSRDDQTDLSVTVYNSDLALVRDVREITLPPAIPAEVHGHRRVRQSRDRPFPLARQSRAALSVLEQNYEYDLLEPAEAAQQVRGP